MTYYKYVKRNAESQPNWAEVAKGISDTLTKTRDAREQKRQEIEERSRKFGELLDNAPQGDNLEFNKLTLDMAEQSKELRRIQDNLLRSGMMSVKDYNMARQTMSDDWDNYTAFAQEANEEYAKKMQEYQDGLISRQTLDEMSYIEGFSNFTATKGHVDHMTGRLGVAKRVYDEETGTYTEDIEETSAMSINELRNRLKRSVQRVDVESELKPSVDALGRHLESVRRAGLWTRESGFLVGDPDAEDQKRVYRDMQEDLINSIITSPDKASSILLDYVGRTQDGKEITTEFATSQEQAEEIKAKGDDSVLVLLRDPKSGNYFADVTDNQRAIITEALKDKMDSMVDYVEEPFPYDPAAAADARDSGRGQKEDTPAITSISQLWYGNENEVKQALDSLKNMPIAVGKSIERIERTERGVIVNYIDKNDNPASQTFDFYDSNDNLKTQEQFAESIGSFFGIQNVRDVLKRSEYDPNRTFGTGVGFSVVERAGEPPKPFDKQSTIVGDEVIMLPELLSEVKGGKGLLSRAYSLEDNSAEAMQVAVSTALSGIPESKKRNMIKNVRDYNGDDVIQLFLPEVMQEPINIPASSNVSNELESALRMIYDAALSRETLIPRGDFSGIITDFENFNNAAADREIGVTRQTGQPTAPAADNPSGGTPRL